MGVHNYIYKKVHAVFPNGTKRWVHYKPVSLRAKWVVKYPDECQKIITGSVSFDTGIPLFEFDWDDDHTQFVDTPIRRESYTDRTELAIARRHKEWSEASHRRRATHR